MRGRQALRIIGRFAQHAGRARLSGMIDDLKLGPGYGGLRLDIGEGQDLADRMAVGDRAGGADHLAVEQHRFAAMAVRLAVGIDGEIGADPGQFARSRLFASGASRPRKSPLSSLTKRMTSASGSVTSLVSSPAPLNIFSMRMAFMAKEP